MEWLTTESNDDFLSFPLVDRSDASSCRTGLPCRREELEGDGSVSLLVVVGVATPPLGPLFNEWAMRSEKLDMKAGTDATRDDPEKRNNARVCSSKRGEPQLISLYTIPRSQLRTNTEFTLY